MPDIRMTRAVVRRVRPQQLLPGPLLSPRRDRVALLLRSSSRLYEAARSRRLQFEHFGLDEPPSVVLARLRALVPTILIGPPSALRPLAEQWDASGPETRPERVYSAAEVLEELERAPIARAFGAPVHQIYQATEGHLGQTCGHGTLHLNEELMVIEREWIDRPSRRSSARSTSSPRRSARPS